MMNSRILWLTILIFAVAVPAWANVSVELFMNRERYMQYEPVYVKVRLRNFSGQPLVFGKTKDLQGELLLEIVHNRRIVPLKKENDFSLIGTVLLPGQSEEFVFRIDQHYKMTKLGNYTVQAYVKHKKLPHVFRSADRYITVAKGVDVWRRTVGVPDVLAGTRSAARKPETVKERSFSVRVLEERGNRHYYVVVEDERRVYCVICVGKEVSSAPRSQEVDMLNRLHMVVPVASRLFRYIVINLDGRIEHQEMLKREDSVPGLIRDRQSGKVSRVGGIEAVSGVDYNVPAPQKRDDQ